MKSHLLSIFTHVDESLGTSEAYPHFSIPTSRVLKIVGQMAILLADLPMVMASTMDVDLLGINHDRLFTLLDQSLMTVGLSLERDHRLIWMPPETTYWTFFKGSHFEVEVADALYVVASKCKFQRDKDRRLILDYVHCFPEAVATIEKMGITTSWLFM